ncbi:hypothetical protein QAD02_024418 [Eretmocerus hayati]|uniref:Uncharacterized protein n=1 Tax=Eretmocerus hayati TaxID=131215 RepID=A0ACC2PZQ0_9HYME|nr:hypothetical protein QAD02_024418 [Eretmocerus hayati]
MRKVLIIVLIGIVHRTAHCQEEPSLECNAITPKSPTARLKRHLFCEYDTSIRPVIDKNKPINVSVSLTPKFMDFDDKTSSFILHTWVFLIWTDQHLTWKPEDFDGVDKIQVRSYEIWEPDFSIYNSGDMGTRQGLPTTMCLLASTGKVLCVPSIKYTSECETDFTHWPYDTQTCDLRLGSWTHTGEEINVTYTQRPVMMVNYSPHKEWKITNYTAEKVTHKFKCCPNDTFPSLIISFDLQRHSKIFHAVYITPAIVLMVITLTVLWLDARSIERISLAAVNFICHLLCLHNMHEILPSNGYSTPNLLLFYRNSMLLAAVAMAITVLLRKLHATKCGAPGCSWAAEKLVNCASVTETTEDTTGDDDSRTVSNSAKSIDGPPMVQSDWVSFALILEKLTFFSGIFAYAVLLWSRIPRSAYGVGY